MCGIAGLYKTSAPFSRPQMRETGKAMAEAIIHRGPDSHGLWQDENSPLTLAHRRLSILDLSPQGAQPMHSASGRYVVVYNGEIYNYLELRKELDASGHTFRGHSDTEVMLAAFEHWGLNQGLQKLNGMFALALWDRTDKTLHLVRDRLGKKPLYIGWAGDSLVFGSELKALHAHPDFKPEINRYALALYTRYSSIPAPHSIYENIWTLPAGCRLSLKLDTLKAGEDLKGAMQPYWNHLSVMEEARAAARPPRNDLSMVNNFEALLKACVRDRMISDVPLGAFLSGGLDSSAVVTMMCTTPGPRVKTYSIGFKEAGFDEAVYARRIADHLGTDHKELYVSARDALDVIPGLSRLYDEPFADISAIPTYLVAKFARQDVTVALSGDGGDEMLGGYNRHFMGPRLWNRIKYLPAGLRRAMARAIAGITVERWDSLMRSQPQFGTRMHKVASIMSQPTHEAIYERLISHWHEAPLNGPVQEPVHPLTDPAYCAPDNLSFGEKMMYWDALSYLPNDILVKVDRATMAVSLEARAPLLDKRIYEHVWRLPLNAKIRGAQGKWLLRQVLEQYIPAELFERPKQGFAMPVDQWLRGDLKDWAGDLLDETRLRQQGYFDANAITQCKEEHLRGEGNHATKLWTILMFQSWLEEWGTAAQSRQKERRAG